MHKPVFSRYKKWSTCKDAPFFMADEMPIFAGNQLNLV